MQLSHAQSVYTKTKHPQLASLVICRGRSIQGECPPLVLVRLERMKILPRAMSLALVLELLVFLWFKRYPRSIPQGLLVMLSEPFGPFWRHGFVASGMVPFAHPRNVLWCGGYAANGA